ncbi:MAG: hypothetical protein ACOZNI_03865 [Myxococcota bacterium]
MEERIGTGPAHSRVSARGVIAGAVVVMAVFGVLSELAGVFGFFPESGVLDAAGAEAILRGAPVWSIAWIAAVLVGGFVAAASTRATTLRDGALAGFVTWAVACLAMGMLFWVGFLAAVRLELATPEFVGALMQREVFLGAFVYDVAAMAAGAVGGLLGARVEADAERRVRVRHVRVTTTTPVP